MPPSDQGKAGRDHPQSAERGGQAECVSVAEAWSLPVEPSRGWRLALLASPRGRKETTPTLKWPGSVSPHKPLPSVRTALTLAKLSRAVNPAEHTSESNQ